MELKLTRDGILLELGLVLAVQEVDLGSYHERKICGIY